MLPATLPAQYLSLPIERSCKDQNIKTHTY
jgi:hypothetical protein